MSKDHLTIKDYSLEFVSNSASATLQLIPYVGGALNQMTFGYLSSLQIKRIENYLIKISEYLQSREMQKEVLDQISVFLHSDNGNEFLYLNLEKASKTRNEEKLKLFRNMFFNQSSGRKTFGLDTAEEFLNILENIKFESVEVLKFMNSYEEPNTEVKYEDENGMLIPPVQQEESEYITSLKKVLPYEIDELNYFHQQLITNGLAIDNSPTSIGINILEQPKITKMGELFLDYIKDNK